MIPKIIHYCWFGGNPLPSLAIRCINSWKKFFPDYEIKEWNENNFDVNIIPYTQEAYQAKKYAFVSDYARFWILYKYGGLYFDTDVEVIKSMDDIIDRGPFMGCENTIEGNHTKTLNVAPGLGLGVNAKHILYKEILDLYANLHFFTVSGGYNLQTVVKYVTDILYAHGLKNVNGIQECAGIYIYPKDWFCPVDLCTGEIRLTSNSRAIHYYAGSWTSLHRRLKKKIQKLIGSRLTFCIIRLKQVILTIFEKLGMKY